MAHISSVWRNFSASKTLQAAMSLNAALVAAMMPASAQEAIPRNYGEVPGMVGKAQVTINVKAGEYATLFAVANASGGKPVGSGILERAGLGVDIYVNDKICTADRDVRRQVDPKTFEGKFATSATCLKILKPGTHVILAEKTSINVEGSKMVLKYAIPGGEVEAEAQTK